MKYLKKFNELNYTIDGTIPRNIQIDLVDLGYELTDDGYSISYQWWPVFNKDDSYPYIMIYKWMDGNYSNIDYNEISDYVDRIKDYLDSKGYSIKGHSIKVSTLTPTAYKIEMINRDI